MCARTIGRRVVIIGGRPLATRGYFQSRSTPGAIADFIDASDVVIRMNNLKNVGVPGIGSRTDILAVTNTGMPGHRYARLARLDHPILAGAGEIWFGTPTEAVESGEFQGPGDSLATHDWAPEILAFQQWTGRPHAAISAEVTRSLAAELRLLGSSKPDPSLGVRVIARVLADSRFAEHAVHLVGFGFQGKPWIGHDFVAEHKWVQGLARTNRITRTPGCLSGLFYPHAIAARRARRSWRSQNRDQVQRLQGTTTHRETN